MKQRILILILCLKCLVLSVLCNVTPACDCVRFTSDGRTQGTFTSPDYDPSRTYRSNVNCILYTFVGETDEIVQLEFLHFDLQMPTGNRCNDYVRFFTDLERPEVTKKTRPNYEACGNLSSVEEYHYSKHRGLVLEFHSDSIVTNNTGFAGRFRFIGSEQFQFIGGTPQWGTVCTWEFRKSKNTSHNIDGHTGRFFSPNYPRSYDPNSNCSYTFFADKDERIKVIFNIIQLPQLADPGQSCERSPDVITVYDGRDSAAPVITRYCHHLLNGQEVISSGNFLYITFHSDGQHQRKGFAAVHEYVKANSIRYPISNDSPPIEQTPRPDVTHVPKVSDRDITYSSNATKEGTFSWPVYKHGGYYAQNQQIIYRFMGHQNERVQLIFDDIKMNNRSIPSPGNSHCSESDTVKVLTHGSRGEDSVLGIFCHTREPLQLMSSGSNMTVIVETKTTDNPNGKGFDAKYRFVTDFGIKTGMQNPFGNIECVFEYRDTTSTNGTFTSPNFPGKYPRNTECHYIFQGKPRTQVTITFPYFDVEGVEKCEMGTTSDYVTFSNYNINTKDRKMPYYCGTTTDKVDRVVHSDASFFRVTFKSNNKFDATGFEGFYQFRALDVFTPMSPTARARSEASTYKLCSTVVLISSVVALFLLL